MLAGLATAAIPVAGRAQDNPMNQPMTALDWAWNEPVTLLDLGMLRLREDIQEAGAVLYEMGEIAGAPLTGVYYSWRDRKIEAYLTVRARPGRENPNQCQDLFFRMIDYMTSGGTSARKKPEWYIENLFTHEPFRGFDRPHDFARQMLETVNFEVTILPAGSDWEGTKFRCGGRLDAEPGTVVANEE